MGTHHHHLPPKLQGKIRYISYYADKLLGYINIWLVKIQKFVKNRNIWQSAKRATHIEEHTQRSKCVGPNVSNFETLTFEITPGMPKMSQSNFVPGTSVATIVTICCNHREDEYFLHRITRILGSTATSTVITGLLPLTDYISGAEKETLRALPGHTNENIEMRTPSAATMMAMVAATTIVRFPLVNNRPLWRHWNGLFHLLISFRVASLALHEASIRLPQYP